eukprot:s6395_g2.t1
MQLRLIPGLNARAMADAAPITLTPVSANTIGHVRADGIDGGRSPVEDADDEALDHCLVIVIEENEGKPVENQMEIHKHLPRTCLGSRPLTSKEQETFSKGRPVASSRWNAFCLAAANLQLLHNIARKIADAGTAQGPRECHCHPRPPASPRTPGFRAQGFRV